MTPTTNVIERTDTPLAESDLPAVEQFSELLIERLDALAQKPGDIRLMKMVKQTVLEVKQLLVTGALALNRPDRLPVSKLKASDVLEQGWVKLSQASFYRAAENKKFYCLTPTGRSIGKEFPAWQFVQPVPELISPVLIMLDDMPSSETHAFWVGEAEELNDLSPAEVLAGLPFETRRAIHDSQRSLLKLPTHERMRKVVEQAKWQLRSMAELVD
ncbi:hypothetical protein RugamoR57_09420 [Duganella caerulea]|uniref:hypothetical protein n=1 Tax=Duganella caerulea TaxID=2885762 RepID=UPI0030E82AD7